MNHQTAPTNGAFATLRQFIAQPVRTERCELCGVTLKLDHAHMIEPIARKMVCACEGCAILLSGRLDSKYKRAPRRICYLRGFRITDAQWEGLRIPINMAFFLRSSVDGRVVALYPSPAGATESLLAVDTWDEIVEQNPVLSEMATDVEALLANRLKDPEYYLLPIDKCYQLVGLIRARWRGLSGGAEVWQDIASFFARLKEIADVGDMRVDA